MHWYKVSIADPTHMIGVFYHSLSECSWAPAWYRVSYILLCGHNLWNI